MHRRKHRNQLRPLPILNNTSYPGHNRQHHIQKPTPSQNITFASIQELGRTPQIQEILANPEPQSFELA